jgi:stage III sporulation protein AG
MEERIETLCEELSGVREAHVLLTLESGVEYVYADGGAWDRESPLLLQEISPQIRGVAVICTGGDDSAVRLTITELLSAALGIPSSRIRVAGK